MIPNLLSIFRMTAFVPVIILFLFEYYLSSFFLFSAAAWSDFLDGFLARKYHLTSNLGSLLDLLADKVLVSSILIFLIFFTSNFYLSFLTLIIILREITISSIRLFLVSKGLEVSKITPDKYGKAKTFFQMLSLSMLLIYPLFSQNFFNFSLLILFFSAFLSLLSFFNYLKLWKSLAKN